jgi:replicative DNA helicase
MSNTWPTVNVAVPHDENAEAAVIGSLILDRDAIVKVAPFLQAADFFREHYGKIYAAILHLYTRHEPPDAVTLSDELTRRGQLEEIGGLSAIVKLVNQTPTAVHVEYYAHIVERKAVRRRLITAGGEVAALAYDESAPDEEIVARASASLVSVQHSSGNSRGFVPLSDALDAHATRTQQIQEEAARGGVVGVPTGLDDIDRKTGGLQPGDLIIPAARPGVGKTAIALTVARNAAKRHGKKVGIVSLEMSTEQLIDRLMAHETGIDAQRIRLGDLSDAEWGAFATAQGRMAEWPIFIKHVGSISIAALVSECQRLHAEVGGIDLLIVDYLQKVRGTLYRDNRVNEVGEVSAGLKSLAMELQIPLIAPAQLNRASMSRSNHAPMLGDLRESGNMEADADVVMLIDRPEMYEPTASNRGLAIVDFAKHRNGPMGIVELHFNSALTLFSNRAHEGRDYNHGEYTQENSRVVYPEERERAGAGGGGGSSTYWGARPGFDDD